MSEEDLIWNVLKDCWTGRVYLGSAYQQAFPNEVEKYKGKVAWDEMGSYMIEILHEEDRSCRCRTSVVLKSGKRRTIKESVILDASSLDNRTFLGYLKRIR